MNGFKVSVIVPVYNTEAYLPRCIESILGQTYGNIEVVLVNDGSTDDSLGICEAYAKRDSRIVVVNQENQGNNAARKAGLRACTGSYVTFVDSDDWIGSSLIEILCKSARQYLADMVISDVLMIRVNGRKEERRNLIAAGVYEDPHDAVKNLFYDCEDGGQHCKYGIMPFVFGKLYGKELLLRSLGQIDDNIQYDEDRALVWTCLMQKIKVVFLHEMEYYYCQRADGLVRSVDEMYLAKINYFYCYMKRLFGTEESILQEQLEQYILWSVKVAFRWKLGLRRSDLLENGQNGRENKE